MTEATSSATKYPNEVKAELPTRLIYVPEIAVFGPLGSWTPASIHRIFDYRKTLGSPICLTTADYNVVACPEVSYHELVTAEFHAALDAFARQYHLDLNVSIRTTFNTTNDEPMRSGGDMSRTQQFTFGNPDDTSGGYACIWFYTKEAYEVDGPRAFWSHLLGETLRLGTDQLEFVLDTWPTDPERVLGKAENIHHDQSLNPFSQIVVVRYRPDRPYRPIDARAFEVECRFRHSY